MPITETEGTLYSVLVLNAQEVAVAKLGTNERLVVDVADITDLRAALNRASAKAALLTPTT